MPVRNPHIADFLIGYGGMLMFILMFGHNVVSFRNELNEIRRTDSCKPARFIKKQCLKSGNVPQNFVSMRMRVIFSGADFI